MATYTTNLNLKKPAQSDKIRIADINGNMDDIDAAFGAVGTTPVATQMGDIREGMAIVSTGNAHGAIAAGQFVYVMGHDTLDDGLYTANEALAANATLSSSNLTAVSGGGLNALNGNVNTKTSLKTVSKAIYNLSAISWGNHYYQDVDITSEVPSGYGLIAAIPGPGTAGSVLSVAINSTTSIRLLNDVDFTGHSVLYVYLIFAKGIQ